MFQISPRTKQHIPKLSRVTHPPEEDGLSYSPLKVSQVASVSPGLRIRYVDQDPDSCRAAL